MKTTSPSARAYQRLGFLAVAHAVAAFGLGFLLLLGGSEDAWRERLWVGLVTLWFFWPVVLALHYGRSILRFAVVMSLAAVVLFPSLCFYNMIAPSAFGLPWVVSMNPVSIWKYYSAYQTGRSEAKGDVAANILAIEESGLPGPGLAHYVRILRERYQIEVRRVAGCVVDEKIEGHQAGYNDVSEREIDRRVGLGCIEAAREEAARVGAEIYAREEQFFDDLAKRLSSLPPNGMVVIKSIRAWRDQNPLNDPAAEEGLKRIVQAVETVIMTAIPGNAPTFELHVSATLTPTEAPKFETSASPSPPDPIYRRIYQSLDSLLLPQWNKDRVSVAMDFTIRQTP
jgi:hypothetical protein